MLDKIIASYGVGNNNDNNDYKYHLFVIGKNGLKLFFYDDGSWGEDIKYRAETDDFTFAYEQLGEMLNDEDMRNHIEANLVF